MSQLPRGTSFDKQKGRQAQLAGVIKGVHSKLREKYKLLQDHDKVWQEHCSNHSLLQEYAEAMHCLATEIWTKHPETRIDWCRKVCREYFLEGGLKKVLDKDKRRQMFAENQDVIIHTKQRQRSKSEERRQCKADITDKEHVPVILSASASQIEHNPKHILVDMTCSCPGCSEKEFPSTSSCGQDRQSQQDTLSANTRPSVLDQFGTSPVSSTSQSHSVKSGTGSDAEFIFGLPEGFAAGQSSSHHLSTKTMFSAIKLPFEGKIRLLDVGSCYNPFQHFEEFDAVGIDLAPAVESVFQCDFLHLDIQDPLQVAADSFGAFLHSLKSPIESLPAETFHVVVFSLLLEYFPSTYQRWICCQKAYQLLAINGILMIITPDSKHQNHNASQMKSWKIAIESIGFKRWRYVKLEHLHCMVFRKVAKQEMPLSSREIGPHMLYIPQDFGDCKESVGNIFQFDRSSQIEEDETTLKSNFEELPDIDFADSEESV